MALQNLHVILLIGLISHSFHFIELYSKQTLKLSVSLLIFDFAVGGYVVEVVYRLDLLLGILAFHQMLGIIYHLLDKYNHIAWHLLSVDFHLLCPPRKTDHTVRQDMFVQLDSIEILIKFLGSVDNREGLIIFFVI